MNDETGKPYSVEKLNQMYDQSERTDTDLFAEMRSNILLVAGDHYTKRTSKFFARLRNTNRLSETQKLRITKNHIHKITRHYRNSIMSKVPGVAVRPQNEMEMQDRKTAELNQAVWDDAKNRYKLTEKKRQWCSDFVEIGEVAVKIFYDPSAGYLKGYAPEMDDSGQPQVDPMTGEMVPDKEKPIFTGDFKFERVPTYDLLRSPYAKTMDESEYIIYRKMVDKQVLKKTYADDEEKLKFIEESSKEAFVVFESQKNQYNAETQEILVKEYYFRPSLIHPEGYFYIATNSGILAEGPLPYGKFPIVWKGFDDFSGTPRARSIIKVARPYQAEINRAASQMATHQISVGDDKIVYQSGTKLAPGALLPGVRGITYQGAPPQILPGREGSQFVSYIEQNIREMYEACMLDEINKDEAANMDPYTMLFRSASQQQRFSQYTEKFEEFLREVCELFLDLARYYMADDEVIKAVGKSEAINVSEFKQTEKLCFKISVEAQSESVDTKMGRQLTLNHVLQYVGKQLNTQEIGRVLKSMPFVNKDSIFDDLTIDQDNVENDMLAIERGEMPAEPSPYANNEYYEKRLTHRMKQADFRMLDPQKQQSYQQLLQEHQQQMKDKQQALLDAKNEYIPIGGALITCQMQMRDPENPEKSKQVRVPYQALDWLIQMLEKQGAGLDILEQMDPGSVNQMYGQQGPPQGALPGLQPGQADALPPQGVGVGATPGQYN